MNWTAWKKWEWEYKVSIFSFNFALCFFSILSSSPWHVQLLLDKGGFTLQCNYTIFKLKHDRIESTWNFLINRTLTSVLITVMIFLWTQKKPGKDCSFTFSTWPPFWIGTSDRHHRPHGQEIDEKKFRKFFEKKASADIVFHCLLLLTDSVKIMLKACADDFMHFSVFISKELSSSFVPIQL